MTNQLTDLVKKFAGQGIINNPNVPNDKNDSTIASVADGILSGLKSEATGDGLGKLIGMFSSGTVNNSITKNIETSVVSAVMNKIGLQSSAAQQVATSVVPSVLNSLVKMIKDPNDSTSGAGILSKLVGSKGAGIDFQSLLDKGLGGSDGKFNLSDAINMFKGGSSNSSSGGLLGAIGSFFGK